MNTLESLSQLQEYKRQRAAGWSPAIALSHCNTQVAWDALDGYTAVDGSWEPAEDERTVRLRWEWDEIMSYDDLAGDCFTLEACQGNARELAASEQRFRDSIECDGVLILIGEYWTGEDWETADCVGGIIGTDAHGYEYDIMQATIEAYNAQDHCPTCGRPKLA